MREDIYKKAEKRVKAKKAFYSHLAAYISVAMFFFIMNMVTLGENPRLWFFFPMLPWGVGLLIHYFATFGLPFSGALSENWEKEEMERELRKARREYGDLEDLDTQSGQEEFMDLKEIRKEKQPNWDKEDLV